MSSINAAVQIDTEFGTLMQSEEGIRSGKARKLVRMRQATPISKTSPASAGDSAFN